jgi:hypothetical protein
MNKRRWYESGRNLLELCVFLVQTQELNTTDEIIHFLSHPEVYSDVWSLYVKEIGILGDSYI